MDNVMDYFERDEYLDGLVEIKNAFENLVDAAESCDAAKDALVTIIKVIKRNNMVLIVFNIVWNVFDNGKDIIDDFKSLIKYWKAQNYQKSG